MTIMIRRGAFIVAMLAGISQATPQLHILLPTGSVEVFHADANNSRLDSHSVP